LIDKQSIQDNEPLLTPIMVPAKVACRLCGVGLSLWYQLDAAGRTPQAVKLNTKRLWVYTQLVLWALHNCPSRDSEQWRKLLSEKR